MLMVGDISSGPTAESDEDDNHINQGIVSDVSSIYIKSSPYLQCWRSLPALASGSDQYSTSDRAGATIANAVLEDFCVVNPKDTSHDNDPSKIQQQCKRKCNQLKLSENSKIVPGIFFDGQKDKTLKNVKKG